MNNFTNVPRPATRREVHPIAVVRGMSPGGTAATVVTCYSALAILNAIASTHPADTAFVQAVR